MPKAAQFLKVCPEVLDNVTPLRKNLTFGMETQIIHSRGHFFKEKHLCYYFTKRVNKTKALINHETAVNKIELANQGLLSKEVSTR